MAKKPKKKAKPAKKAAKKKAAPGKTGKTGKRSEKERFAPATLQTLENGKFSISFDAALADEFIDLWEEEGLSGSGYESEAVLAPAFEKKKSALASEIENGPEADPFVAIADRVEPLEALAALVRDLLDDEEALARAIRAHDQERT